MKKNAGKPENTQKAGFKYLRNPVKCSSLSVPYINEDGNSAVIEYLSVNRTDTVPCMTNDPVYDIFSDIINMNPDSKEEIHAFFENHGFFFPFTDDTVNEYCIPYSAVKDLILRIRYIISLSDNLVKHDNRLRLMKLKQSTVNPLQDELCDYLELLSVCCALIYSRRMELKFSDTYTYSTFQYECNSLLPVFSAKKDPKHFTMTYEGSLIDLLQLASGRSKGSNSDDEDISLFDDEYTVKGTGYIKTHPLRSIFLLSDDLTTSPVPIPDILKKAISLLPSKYNIRKAVSPDDEKIAIDSLFEEYRETGVLKNMIVALARYVFTTEVNFHLAGLYESFNIESMSFEKNCSSLISTLYYSVSLMYTEGRYMRKCSLESCPTYYPFSVQSGKKRYCCDNHKSYFNNVPGDILKNHPEISPLTVFPENRSILKDMCSVYRICEVEFALAKTQDSVIQTGRLEIARKFAGYIRSVAKNFFYAEFKPECMDQIIEWLEKFPTDIVNESMKTARIRYHGAWVPDAVQEMIDLSMK